MLVYRSTAMGAVRGAIVGSDAVWKTASQAQTAAAPMSGPPQQMPVYGVPDAMPYPSTSSPGTSALMSGIGAAAPPADSPQFDGAIGPANESAPLYAPYGSPDAMTAAHIPATDAFVERSLVGQENWGWQILPRGLLYKTNLAGGREPRLATQLVHERNLGWLWDSSLGARVGIVRYGNDDPLWLQGWQLDVEGTAFPRLYLDQDRDMISTDFRAGIPLTTRQGPWEAKFGYYHYCSHLGDEYIENNPDFRRLNYVRETLLLGVAVYLNPSLRLYSEAGWAFWTDGGAKPWEFEFGLDFSSPEPTGPCGAPFFAINGHLRQENDFGGNMTVQTGWQWRGRGGQLFRLGMQYFNGMSDQRQFFDTFEEQIGFGLWYDF